MTTPPLFGLPDPDPLPRSQKLSKGRSGIPSWSRYRTKNRLPCDECIAVLQENNGRGPYARSVRWKRTLADEVLYLCHEHAEQWRAQQ